MFGTVCNMCESKFKKKTGGEFIKKLILIVKLKTKIVISISKWIAVIINVYCVCASYSDAYFINCT